MKSYVPVLYKNIKTKNGRVVIQPVYRYENEIIHNTRISVIIHTQSGLMYKYDTTIFYSNMPSGILFLILDDEVHILKDNFIKLVHIIDGHILIRDDYKIIHIKTNSIIDNDSVLGNNISSIIDNIQYTKLDNTNILNNIINITKFNLSYNNLFLLRKLVINNMVIPSIDLSYLNLEYINLQSNFIKKIKYNKYLEYCDLSHNNLRSINIKGRVVLLYKNKIEYFINENIYDILDLDDNPLKVFKGLSRILKVNYTKLRNISIPECEQLECESVVGLRVYRAYKLKLVKSDEITRYKRDKGLHIDNRKNGVIETCNNIGIPNIMENGFLGTNTYKLNNIVNFNKRMLTRLKNRINTRIQKIRKNGLEYAEEIWNKIDILPSNPIETEKFIKYIELLDSVEGYTKYAIGGLSERFFILYRNIPDFDKVMSCILPCIIHGNIINTINFVYDNLKKICINTDRGIFYIVSITKLKIFIKSYQIKILVRHYLRLDIILDNGMYMYDNLGEWYILPLNNKREQILIKEKYKNIPDCMVEYDIKNTIFTSKLIGYLSSGFKKFKQGSVLRIYKKYLRVIHTELIGPTENALFIYLTTFYPIIHNIEVLDKKSAEYKKYKKKEDKMVKKQTNLYNKLARFSICCLIEKSGKDGLIWVGTDMKVILDFCMFITRICRSYGLKPVVGISCGMYSLLVTYTDCKIIGSVLNKASRMSTQGIGVYCCECLIILEGEEYEFKYIGERNVIGFSSCLRMYYVRYLCSIHKKEEAEFKNI